VSGTSSFAADFAKAGPHDSRGRSLRDLDLQTRVFKYPFSYLDQAIPFLPWTVCIYHSLIFLLFWATFLQPDRKSLYRFALGYGLLVLAAGIVFWLYPTQLPPPEAAQASWIYEHLLAPWDSRNNTLPSLHAALTIYAGLALLRLGQGRQTFRALIGLWMILLLACILTTKQHIILDLVNGALAGGVAFVFSFRDKFSAETK